MSSFFHNRGYPPDVVHKGLQRASLIPRQSALAPTHRLEDQRPVAVVPYHPHHLPFKRILLSNWDILSDDSEVGASFRSPPLIAYKRATNIRDMLVHSRLRSSQRGVSKPPGTHPCSKSNCAACPFLNSSNLIIGHAHRRFTVRRSFNCQMSNLVYAITCKSCSMVYIGETSRTLETRFKEHLADVRHSRERPVALHFNSHNHSIRDISVAVVWKCRAGGDTFSRKHIESMLIRRLGTMAPYGINLKT